MATKTLDLQALRALITANDVGGFRQAATQLNRTPSAVSLQMKRLQRSLGVTLFRKDGRRVALTESGELVLRFSRQLLALNDELLDTVRGASLTGQVRLGCSQDFADSVLPGVLSRFVKLYPLVLVEVHIEGNASLVEAVKQGRLDVALAVGHDSVRTSRTMGECQLAWIAGRQFALRDSGPVPLVALGPQCAFRMEAIRRLDEKRIPWRLAAVSPSLAGLWATARGGLGITARSAHDVPADLVAHATLFGLPTLGAFPITLHARTPIRNPCIKRLYEIVSAAVAESLASVGGN